MKNKTIAVGTVLLLTFLIFSFAKADLVTGVSNLDNEGRAGELLTYKVNFQNIGDSPMYISIFVDAVVSPNEFTLAAGQLQPVYINYTIPSQTPAGTLFITVKLFDQSGKEYNDSVILQGTVLPQTYPFKNVMISGITVSKSSVNAESTFNLDFAVTGVPQNTTATVNIAAPFELAYPKSLDLISGRNDIVLKDLSVPVSAAPGTHTVTLSLTFKDTTVLSKNFTLSVVGYSKCETSEQKSVKFVSKEYSATLTNPGTAPASCTVSTSISSIEKMLMNDVTKGYQYNYGKMSWTVEVPAGQSVTVGYTVSYILAIVIPFVVIIVAVLFWYYLRKMEIIRELVDYKLYPGCMDMKLQIHVKNLSNKRYRNVSIKEPLGAYVKEVKEFGTVAGKVITENKKKMILWEIDELKPKEERVFNYKVRTSVEVLGQINFGSTVVEYMDENNNRREEYAHVFSVEIE